MFGAVCFKQLQGCDHATPCRHSSCRCCSSMRLRGPQDASCDARPWRNAQSWTAARRSLHHCKGRDPEMLVHLGDLSGRAERARVDKPAFGRYGSLSPFAPAPPLPCRAPCRGSDRDRPRPASRTAASTASTRICHGFGAGGRLTGGVPSGSGMSSGPGLGGGDGGRGGIMGSGI